MADRMDEIRERLKEATPGPWEAVASEDRHHMSWVRDPSMPPGCDSICLVGASEVETEQANCELIAHAPADLAWLVARVEELEKALREAEETLRLPERPSRVDPVHGEKVAELGDRIGYGALMSSASASWRAKLAATGDAPVGGEFVAGPCHSTVVRTLAIVRAALEPTP